MKLVTIFTICLITYLCTNMILSPQPRDLYLIYRTDAESNKDLAHSLGYQKFAMKHLSEHFKAARIESQIDELLEGQLDKYEQKFQRIMEKLDEADRDVDENFSSFYQKYVQMPYIGNFSYIDPTNPLSLH